MGRQSLNLLTSMLRCVTAKELGGGKATPVCAPYAIPRVVRGGSLGDSEQVPSLGIQPVGLQGALSSR